LYYDPQAQSGASFAVEATSSDAQSGIDHVGYPAIPGMSGAGSYSWTTGAAASGPQTVTATNGAGLPATATFELAPDTTAPAGEGVALSGGPWYAALSV